jgi:hypothetical protein
MFYLWSSLSTEGWGSETTCCDKAWSMECRLTPMPLNSKTSTTYWCMLWSWSQDGGVQLPACWNLFAGRKGVAIWLLHAYRNGMGDRGVKSVVEALEANTVLRRLDLRVNSIGLVSTVFISDWLHCMYIMIFHFCWAPWSLCIVMYTCGVLRCFCEYWSAGIHVQCMSQYMYYIVTV